MKIRKFFDSALGFSLLFASINMLMFTAIALLGALFCN